MPVVRRALLRFALVSAAFAMAALALPAQPPDSPKKATEPRIDSKTAPAPRELPGVRLPDLAAELVVNPRTVSQAYQELEREGVVYVRRGQGTFVSPTARREGAERRGVAREVAKRALLEARRNRMTAEELVTTIQEIAAEEAQTPEPSGEEKGAAR
jgi:GntR family transcriptional regulator